jgi:hypothetical protein
MKKLICIIIILFFFILASIFVQFAYGRYQLTLNDISLHLLHEKRKNNSDNADAVFIEFEYEKSYVKKPLPFFTDFIFSNRVDIENLKLILFKIYAINSRNDSVDITLYMENDISATAAQELSISDKKESPCGTFNIIESDSIFNKYNTKLRFSLYDHLVGNVCSFTKLINSNYFYIDGGIPTGFVLKFGENVDLRTFDKICIKVIFSNGKSINQLIDLK